MANWHSKETDDLFKAISQLNTIEECYDFFEDLCTVPEMKAMAQRAAVAKLLYDKTVYNDIVVKAIAVYDGTTYNTATIRVVNAPSP